VRFFICVKACLAIAAAMAGCSSDDPLPPGTGGAGATTSSGGSGGDPGCDPATCPQPEDECQFALCDGGACGFGNVQAGLACNGGSCDSNGACVEHCNNSVKDFSETDVDCGGNCDTCAVGQGCIVEEDCASGFCIDETCCGTACDGVCEACNLAGEAGTCTPHPAGTDPDDDCAPLTCNGAGECE
jgi:hypothetical protein